jgi:hypothetical protein
LYKFVDFNLTVVICLRFVIIEMLDKLGPGGLNELDRWITKKGALDSQPQVIEITSCLPMVCGSLRASSTNKTGRHDIAKILLKVALKHQKLIKINH